MDYVCSKCDKECFKVRMCHACSLDYCLSCEPNIVVYKYEFYCPDCINELHKRLYKYD